MYFDNQKFEEVDAMKPYACKLVNQEDQKLFANIQKVIWEMPEVNLGLDARNIPVLVSCHMLARAIARFFPVTVHDGHFVYGPYRHSWVTTKTALIDVYPIAMIGGPILLDKTTSNPLLRQYVDEGLQDATFNENEKFFSYVDKVADAVERTIKKLKIENS